MYFYLSAMPNLRKKIHLNSLKNNCLMKDYLQKASLLLVIPLFLIFTLNELYCQAAFNYQSIVRDADGAPISDKEMMVVILLREGHEQGDLLYEEEHLAETNQFGIINLKIGRGMNPQGDLSEIDWGAAAVFMEVEIEYRETGVMQTLGVSELLSVPYAMYSMESGTPGPPGPEGPPGPQGEPGQDFIVIDSTINNGDGTFTLIFSDGTSFTTDTLTGPPGPSGLSDGSEVGNTIFWDGSEWVVNNNNLFHDGERVGIGTNTPSAMLHIHDTTTGSGNVLFTGEFKFLSTSDAPIEGPGTRMMWYPERAAFRAGRVTGNEWDTDNIGDMSAAWGGNVIASGFRSAAWGDGTKASGRDCTAWGSGTKSTGVESTAWGRGTEAYTSQATAWGLNTIAYGVISTAWGRNTNASGTGSTAWGTAAEASGSWSTAWGHNTEATGLKSTSWGSSTKASGFVSTAWGSSAEASATRATAWGLNSVASGIESTSWGRRAEATGDQATAWGWNTGATGINSTAWGRETEASGRQSTAWGRDTEASGQTSTAWGFGTVASGVESTAWGGHTTAPSLFETALGRYNTNYVPNAATNWDSEDRLFVIGNGTSPSNRSDAMVMLKNGNMGLGISSPTHKLAIPVTTKPTSQTANGDGIGIVNTDSGNFWNIHMSASSLRFSYNGINNGSRINQDGEYIQNSDKRLKTNIANYSNVLDRVSELRVMEYHYLNQSSERKNIGFIAQDVLPVFPELVAADDDYLGINYSGFSVVAIKAIQEQQEQIEEQDSQIDKLQDQILSLKEENKKLRERAEASENQTAELLKAIQKEIQELRAEVENPGSEKIGKKK